MSDALDRVVTAIAAGEVVVIPTDTVYGLACDPSNDAAVERIYTIKDRPAGLVADVVRSEFAGVRISFHEDLTRRDRVLEARLP